MESYKNTNNNLKRNRTKIKIVYPERGTIFDLYGYPIASNKIDYQLSIFKDQKDLINKYVYKLNGHINFTEKDFKEIAPITDHIHFYGMYLGNYPELTFDSIREIASIISSVEWV